MEKHNHVECDNKPLYRRISAIGDARHHRALRETSIFLLFLLLFRDNSDHFTNGLLKHAVVCVQVVHSKISVDVIKYRAYT